MDMQERLERFRAVNERANESFERVEAAIAPAFGRLNAALWDLFMKLPEEERDRLDPDWREGYAQWAEHRTGTGQL